ncbi:MAG: outer membrane protein assembly factor BamA [Thermoanaerobaculia bacterium]
MRRGSFGTAVLAAVTLSFGTVTGQEPGPTPVPTPPPAPAAVEAAPGTPLTGETIVGIRVVGYQTVSPDTIAHYLGVKVGEPYDPETIRANFHKLWDVGLLENVRIEAERAGAGVTLVVTIEERPIIKEVEFKGNKKLSTSQIKDVLKENKIEVRAGAPLSLRDIARERSAIAEMYVAQGFRSATVDYRIEDLSKTEKKVVFVIDEGDKVKIESIMFTGNTAVSAQTLRNAMKKTKVATFWRILSDNTVYSQANYEADVEGIKAVYQARGYKNVVVKDPTLDVYVVDPKKEPKKIKRRVRITLPIVEGDKFYTNEIHITAVQQNGQPTETGVPTVFPIEVLKKQFWELPPGSVLNRDRLVEALSSMEAKYKSRGFIYWFADPQFKEIGDHKVDLDLRIFEGEKFYLGRLEVQGNTQTRDKVIRREFALNEGEVLDMEAVKKSVTKIQQLGYFKMTEEPQFGVRPEEKKVDIVIKGQETSRNEIQFGAGYSGFDGFFGQFSFQTRNFLGRGEIIGASAQLGKVSNYFDLSYTVPWFMDRNQSVGLSLFRRRVNYLSIDESRQGGSAFYGKGIGLFDSLSMLYAYEDIKASFPVRSAPVPPGQPAPPQKFTETTGTTSSLTPAYRYDSRNDPFDPTRGFRLFASVQYAPSYLGSSAAFLKPGLGSTIYIPSRFPRRALLGLNFEAGYVKGLSGDSIPIFERFQLGGEQSLRGFRVGAVVPLHKDTNQVFTDEFGRILGGNKFFVLNIEYQFLQVGPAKLLAFVDLGNNYHESQNFDITRVRSSAGAELRIFLPIFQAPLRFIYSFNLHPIQPIDQFGFPVDFLTERKSGFDFSIGRTF